MFGFIPIWGWALSAGWVAKGMVDKVAGGAAQQRMRVAMPGQPGQPGQQPMLGQPQQQMVVGGGRSPTSPPCQFDAHMDEMTERAVSNCLRSGSPQDLRGFAQSLLAGDGGPMYPMAAGAMRWRAREIEMQMQAAAALRAQQQAQQPPAPAPVAAAPAPSPKPEPKVEKVEAPHAVNGAAHPVAVTPPDDPPAPAPAPAR